MNLQLLSRLEVLQENAPMPWYLEQDNDSGICVKDATGETVFFEDYGSVPDEAPSGVLEGVVGRARALARFLVEWSKNPHA